MNAKSLLKSVSDLKYSFLGVGLVLVVAVSAVLIAQNYVGGVADDSNLNSVISEPKSGDTLKTKTVKKKPSAEEAKLIKSKALFETSYAKFQKDNDKLLSDFESALDDDDLTLSVAQNAVKKSQTYCRTLTTSFPKTFLKKYKTSLNCGNLVSNFTTDFNDAIEGGDIETAKDLVLDFYDKLSVEFDKLKEYVGSK